jgi:5-methylcytosine-specific restriction endonuclease McrA
MIAQLSSFRRVPRILRLNLAGYPIEWLSWQEAVCLYARDIVVWTMGNPVLTIRGGISRYTGIPSGAEVHAIIACEGRILPQKRSIPPLTNKALFRRDQGTCLYCGKRFLDQELSRDHVVPISKGGADAWDNVVSACRRCNHHKGNRLVEECRLDLIALPYIPNYPEYLVLINGGRILSDQMDFLRKSFKFESRLLQ